MKKVLGVLAAAALCWNTSAAQTVPTKFGFGVGIGSSTSILASWAGERWKFEPNLAITYSTTNYDGPSGANYMTSSNQLTASLAMSYFWVSPVEKELSVYYGPRLSVGVRTVSMEFSTSTSNSSKSLVTGAGFILGGEYPVSTHFTIAGQFGPSLQITGRPTLDPSQISWGTSLTLGSMALIRWYL